MITKHVGSGTIRSQFLFFKINPRKHTRASMRKSFLDVLRIVSQHIEEETVTSYTAFFEDPTKNAEVPHKNAYAIPGNINWLSVENVESVLKEKLKHASPEYRKKGMVSKHPPKFLTPQTVVVVMGSTKFLLRNLQLYLEQEGILRDQTFDLLVDIACLEATRGRRRDNYLHVHIQDATWYRGNVEALGDFVSRHHTSEHAGETLVMTDEEMLQRIGSSP